MRRAVVAGLALVAAVGSISCGGTDKANDDTDGGATGEVAPASEPCAPRPEGAPAGTPSLLVYQAIKSEIWSVRVDDGHEQKLILGSGPRWSPDGAWIAFVDGQSDGLHFQARLCAMRSDGSEVKDLAGLFFSDVIDSCAGGRSYSWSRSGNRLVYDNDGTMFTVSADDGPASNLILTHGVGPDWSPDDKRIAFASPTGNPDAYCGVWVVYDEDRERHDLLFEGGQASSFSPDGERIAYVGQEGGRVMVGDADGGEAEPVAELPREGAHFLAGPNELTWSPDGKSLAYTFFRSLEQGELIRSVFVVDVDGGREPKQVATGSDPEWSPDGRFLAYVLDEEDSDGRHDTDAIYVIDAKGDGDPRFITEGKGPSWSPDGSQIAFTRSPGPFDR